MRVLGDVGLGGGQANAFLQLNQAFLLQQQQRAGFVGAIVGNRNLRAVGQRVQRSALAGVQAEGLIVDAGHAHQMGAVLFIEVVQVGDVLEVVGIQLALFQRGVGDDIVVEFHDLQIVAFVSQNLLDNFQNLGVGRGGCADLDGLIVGRTAAGGQGQGQCQGQYQCNDFFHLVILLFSIYF